MKISKKLLFGFLPLACIAMVTLRSCTPAQAQSEIKIHLLLDKTFVGDCNQAKGIGKAFTQIGKNNGLHTLVREWDLAQVADCKTALTNEHNAQHVVVSIGSSGIKLFSQENFDPAYTIWAGHQIFDDLKNVTNKVDIIALPGTSVSQGFKNSLETSKTNLVETIGVAHNLHAETLKKAQKDWSGTPLLKASCYIGVFLGGDAPTADGSLRYFTSQEAASLGHLIAKIAQESQATVLITNGPRTGKYNPQTGSECAVHKENSAADLTSTAYIQSMQENGIAYQFFDFKQGMPSAYQAILDLLHATPNSKAFVTGDSTSMISEICDVMPYGTVYVTEVGSMNNTHQAFVNFMHENGHANRISLKDQKIDRVINQKLVAEKQAYSSAAHAIAEHAIDSILKNNSAIR